MKIYKRDAALAVYDPEKIKNAIGRAFSSVGSSIAESESNRLLDRIESKFPDDVNAGERAISVEEIQDFVERTLMEENYYKELKSYILYREGRARRRISRQRIAAELESIPGVSGVLAGIQKEFIQEEYELEQLNARFQALLSPGLTDLEKLAVLVKACAELTTQEAPKWEMIAARIRMLSFDLQLDRQMQAFHIHSF